MAWRVEFNAAAEKKLYRLSALIRTRILKYLSDRIEDGRNPRLYGSAMTGEPSGRWRYRVGDYRIICRIEDDGQVVVVLTVGHRRDVYR